MESIDLKRLNLTIEESRDIINFIAQKRGISTEKILSTIKPNLKHKNNEILTTTTHQEATKIHQEATKIHQEAKSIHQEAKKTHEKIKKAHEKIKIIKKIKRTQQKSLKLQNLTYEKPSKLVKRENLTSQNKKRIDTAREKLKELRNKLLKNDLKKLKKHLYNIESKKKLLESETTKEYFDELDKKFLEFDDNDNDGDFIGIENVQDLFKISIYKSAIVKRGYNNNYIEYRSEGDKLLTIEEYLNLIEPYLRELINDHKNKGEWKSN